MFIFYFYQVKIGEYPFVKKILEYVHLEKCLLCKTRFTERRQNPNMRALRKIH